MNEFKIINNYFKSLTKKNPSAKKLNDDIFYDINPEILDKDEFKIYMQLDNQITDKNNTINYSLKMTIWNNNSILNLCNENGLKLIGVCSMLNVD